MDYAICETHGGGYKRSCTKCELEAADKENATLRALADIAMQTKAQWDSQIAMTVARLGGTVEGAPTHAGNFLQRIDELRKIERAALAPRSERREQECPMCKGKRWLDLAGVVYSCGTCAPHTAPAPEPFVSPRTEALATAFRLGVEPPAPSWWRENHAAILAALGLVKPESER